MANEFIARKGIKVLANGAIITGSTEVHGDFTASGDVKATNFRGSGQFLTDIAADSVQFDSVLNKPTLISSSAQFISLSDPFTGSFTGSFTGDGSGLTGIAATLAISGSTGSDTVDLKNDALIFSGSNGVTTAVTDNTVTISIPTGTVSASSQIDHDATTNYVADQHVAHSTVNISAGNGLTGGGTIAASRTLTLDTGSTHFTGGVKTKLNTEGIFSSSAQVSYTGISDVPAGIVSSSSQVDHNATTNYVADEHVAHSTVNIDAGSGLSGGGTIAASRTLTLDTGSTHFTGGVKTTLNTNTVVSSSTQIVSALPTGTVSSSIQVDHNATTNYVANQHIDHSAVDISAGSGLSGGGNITATRTLTLDTGSAHFTGGVKTKLNTDLVVSGSANDVKIFLSLENVDNTSDVNKPLSTAQKAYVDEVAQGLKTRTAARVLVDTNLDATYDNGVNGSGSFLESNTNEAFPTTDGVDSTELNVVGVRLLITGQLNKAHNGLYVVQTAGNGSTPWKIRRCVECDSSEEIPGSFVFIKSGTVYANTGWVLLVDNPSTFTIGEDDINPTQFSGAGSFLAGDGLGLDGNVFSLDTGSTHFTGGVKTTLNANTVVSSSVQVDHNSTTNYVADQHIAHSTVEIAAGSGLSGGGNITATRTLTLDTGSTHFTGGVKTTLNANTVVSSSTQIVAALPAGTISSSIQVDHNATTNYVANQHIDHSTVDITAGLGLSGGGNITATRTVTLDTGSVHFITGSRKTISASNTSGASGINLTYNDSTGVISGSLVNSSITINGSSVDLGGTRSITLSEITAQGATTTNQVSLNGGAIIHGTLFTSSSESGIVGPITNDVVATFATGSYDAAHFDYVIKDGTNYRTGTVMAVWNGSDGVQFTDTSTNDIGNTLGAEFVVDTFEGNARLKFTTTTGTWTVKTSVRLF